MDLSPLRFPSALRSSGFGEITPRELQPGGAIPLRYANQRWN